MRKIRGQQDGKRASHLLGKRGKEAKFRIFILNPREMDLIFQVQFMILNVKQCNKQTFIILSIEQGIYKD